MTTLAIICTSATGGHPAAEPYYRMFPHVPAAYRIAAASARVLWRSVDAMPVIYVFSVLLPRERRGQQGPARQDVARCADRHP
jgi:hypothetical protein